MRIKRLLRAHRWWDVQIPVMLAPVYLVLAVADPMPPVTTILATLALFLLASIGIAGFGHLVNDLFDVEQDRASGASNLAASRGPLAILGLSVLLLATALVPWRWLPTSPAIWALLGLEFALFILYSVPVVRLKERGILGPVADALYSWTVSTAVALLVFARLGDVAVPWWQSGLLAAWAFALGFRHILTHQIEDVGRDEAAGMTTFVSRFGWMRTFRLLERVVLPIELSLLVALLAVAGLAAPLVPAGFVVWTAATVAGERRRALDPRWLRGRGRGPAIHRLFFANITLLHRFYTLWLPLLALATLAWRHPSTLPLLAAHLLVFENGAIQLGRAWLARWTGRRVAGEVA